MEGSHLVAAMTIWALWCHRRAYSTMMLICAGRERSFWESGFKNIQDRHMNLVVWGKKEELRPRALCFSSNAMPIFQLQEVEGWCVRAQFLWPMAVWLLPWPWIPLTNACQHDTPQTVGGAGRACQHQTCSVSWKLQGATGTVETRGPIDLRGP